MSWLRSGIAMSGVVLALACATSPTGRTQLKLFSEAELDAMGAAAFANVKQETPAARDSREVAYVRCIAGAITGAIQRSAQRGAWEVAVFDEKQANAFALPGRKIGVFSGIVEVAATPDQLATVIGHEVAHVLAGHPNERLSTAYATQSGLQILAVLSGASSGSQSQLMALLGLGAQVGVEMPFARSQETEADLLGLDLMARAGFDPRASVEFWRNMAKAGGANPPTFLSTHPSRESRMRELNARLPRALPLYQQARAAGRRPSCRR